eukprot:9404688-Pyramimonas_sp.AAC.1
MLKPAKSASSLAISNRAKAESMRSPLSTLMSTRVVLEVNCRSTSRLANLVLSRHMKFVIPSVRLPCEFTP